MAKLTDDIKHLILSDFHTGQFSQRKLAQKYGVSTATINKLTKGLDAKNEHKVNAIATIHAELEDQSEQEVNAVHLAVDEKTKHIQLVNSLTELNLKGLKKSLERNTKDVPTKMGVVQVDLSPADYKAGQEAIDKASITLGVNERFSSAKVEVNTQQNNNQEVNNEITITRLKQSND